MTTDHVSFAGLGLGAIDQVSFAVEDLAAVLPMYEAIFGPFTVRETSLDPERTTYRGKPASARLLLGFGRSGNVEIELVQVLSGEAPATEHLRSHGPGLHHVRFPVADHAAAHARLEAAGFTTIMSGVSGRGSLFSYLEAPASFGSTVFELIQPPGDA